MRERARKVPAPPLLPRPRAFPRPRPAVSATVDRSVFSLVASRNVTTALACARRGRLRHAAMGADTTSAPPAGKVISAFETQEP